MVAETFHQMRPDHTREEMFMLGLAFIGFFKRLNALPLFQP